jgi:hypothetical protein
MSDHFLLRAEPNTGAAGAASARGRNLFEFQHGHDRHLCELRDHGET